MFIAGVMSGTSLDGARLRCCVGQVGVLIIGWVAAIDVALTRIEGTVVSGHVKDLGIHLEAFHTFPWAPEDRAAILNIIHNPFSVSLKEFGRVNGMIAARIADAVRSACTAASVPLASLDLIASHGIA
jgi:1,6-anhydro-N-acetylmuramate kinase